MVDQKNKPSKLRVVVVILASLLAVSLAVAINVATGGTLPGIDDYRRFVWPAVAVLTLFTIVVALLQTGSAGQVNDEKRSSISNLPPRNPFFAGREGIFTVLDDRPHGWPRRVFFESLHRRASPHLPKAVCGMGGVGKTQIALEYAYRRRRDYAIKWWVAAEYPDEISRTMRALAIALGLVSAQQADKDEHAIPLLMVELAQRRDWMIVFDNVVNPLDVVPYLPPSRSGEILITSQNPSWGTIAEVVEVESFSRDETIFFLRNRLRTASLRTSELIGERLSDLPLALEQAAAYMDETGITPERYLELLSSASMHRLWDRGLPLLYGRTVAITFALAYEKVLTQNATAARMLDVFAFLDPDNITPHLLISHRRFLDEDLAAAMEDEVTYIDALGTLAKYSLISKPSHSMRIHRLVQQILSNRMLESGSEAGFGAALRIMNADIGRPYNSIRPLSGFESHALIMVEQAEGLASLQEDAAELLFSVGRNYEASGHPDTLSVLSRSLARFEDLYGPDHPKVGAVLFTLGLAMMNFARSVDKALPLLRRSMRILASRDLDSLGMPSMLPLVQFNLRRAEEMINTD